MSKKLLSPYTVPALAAALALPLGFGCELSESGSEGAALAGDGSGDDGDASGDGDLCRTQGYWLTHAESGPAGFDETWDELPEGEETEFFLSGQSYYGAITTEPAGNAYYILASQYIAAELNQIAGAGDSQIADAFADATEILEDYAPEDVADLADDSDLRAEIIELAGILDQYNNAELGGGDCRAGDGDGGDDGDGDGDDDDDDGDDGDGDDDDDDDDDRDPPDIE